MSSIGRESSVALEDENEIERVFRRFDANGDGKISANDLRKVLLSLGTSASQEEIQRMMKEIDTNDDGFVDLEEFKDFHRDNASPDGGLGELREAFDLYDLDKNGLISAIELHKVLNGLGEKCSMEDCRRMIGSVDADRDGYVNFEEFKRMMTNKSSH